MLGAVDLGPKAIVHGDVVTVGGRLHRAAGARVDGSVTEVALGDVGDVSSAVANGREPFRFGGFGPVTRLVGTTFRFVPARARRVHRARRRAPRGRGVGAARRG